MQVTLKCPQSISRCTCQRSCSDSCCSGCFRYPSHRARRHVPRRPRPIAPRARTRTAPTPPGAPKRQPPTYPSPPPSQPKPPPNPNPPPTRQNTPRVASRVFWKKLLLRARRPLNTPPTPPASPHPLQAPPPVTCPMPRGPASPSPSRLWADPPCRWPLPRRGRSRRPKLGISLKKIRPNRLSPARPLWGRAGERRFPPSPPRLCGPRPPRRPCTLSTRSTVTLESRS